ncbi:MFS transporter [Bowdeniella nasicola]|uniref:MFS transporter n=1 Tax=Bowdeniella nasicola TaxID=208480 RepID=UPI001C9E6148|nr:MFS transporter [Bowdeniella nasicola]
MSSSGSFIDKLLRRDAEHEDAHELREEARGNIRHNSMTFVLANGLQNIGDQAAKASTVLPWVISATGAPTWMTGLLVPIRESGSMLPQAALQPWVRFRKTRREIWIAGGIGQAFGLALVAFAAATLSGVLAGFAVLGGLALQAVSRSLNSIASKDIQGRTMPKGLRGRVSGLSTTISGLVAITVGLAVRVFGGEDLSRTVLALLVGGAALSFVIGAMVFRGLREGEAEAVPMTEANSWISDSWELFTHDAPFRRFVIVRSLLLVSALAPPFVVALSAERSGATMSSVATFIVASGLAALIGGRVSGVVSDRSSKLTMIVGAGIASAIIAVFIASTFIEPLISQWWWGPVIFFLLTVVHTGVRVARKTYVVDMAEGDQRTQYVAVSNTAMGVTLLIAGAISSGLTLLGPLAALIFLGALGIAGVLVGRTLEEVSVGYA